MPHKKKLTPWEMREKRYVEQGIARERSLFVSTYPRRTAKLAGKYMDAVVQTGSQLVTYPFPSLLYHYTTDVGLSEIVRTGKLWMSDIQSLNDPEEFEFGLRDAVQTIRKTWGGSRRDDVSLMMNLVWERFQDISQSHPAPVAHPFVTSFSANQDELNQWRAYGSNGRGFSLGFDLLELRMAMDPTRQLIVWGEVAYGKRRLRQLVSEVAGASLPLAESSPKSEESAYWMLGLLHRLKCDLSVLSMFHKHPAYRHEAEHRFVKFLDRRQYARIASRVRDFRFVKYLPVQWRTLKHNPLKRIVVGPAANFEASREFIVEAFRRCRQPLPEIVRSQVPYR